MCICNNVCVYMTFPLSNVRFSDSAVIFARWRLYSVRCYPLKARLLLRPDKTEQGRKRPVKQMREWVAGYPISSSTTWRLHSQLHQQVVIENRIVGVRVLRVTVSHNDLPRQEERAFPPAAAGAKSAGASVGRNVLFRHCCCEHSDETVIFSVPRLFDSLVPSPHEGMYVRICLDVFNYKLNCLSVEGDFWRCSSSSVR